MLKMFSGIPADGRRWLQRLQVLRFATKTKCGGLTAGHRPVETEAIAVRNTAQIDRFTLVWVAPTNNASFTAQPNLNSVPSGRRPGWLR
ncbi:MAG: hypothetical protein CM15mP120_04430 [Pseudomonadota bacterium]|nr:MAG: hypothetical protein CM15mP120_04430 [Pseudomonadota bacterium]